MWPVVHAGIGTPCVNRITHRCKNITLPQTSFAGGKNSTENLKIKDNGDTRLAYGKALIYEVAKS